MIHHDITATQEEVIRVLKTTAKNLESVLQSKGQDYSGKEDTFKNFKLSADLLGISVEMVILSRMGDKLSRMASIFRKGHTEVKDETVIDTIDDLIGYAVLLKTYLEKKEEKKVIQDPEVLRGERTTHKNDTGKTTTNGSQENQFDDDTSPLFRSNYAIIDDDGEY